MPVRQTIVPLAVSVALLAAVLCGCAQSDDRAQVRDVAQRFSAALTGGDGAVACSLLDAAARSALEQQEQEACPQAIGRLALSPSAVRRVRVYITNAQVELGDGEVAFLDRAREGWRLSAVGCRFEHGKPHDRPATCELES
jgi:hypothetical protein